MAKQTLAADVIKMLNRPSLSPDELFELHVLPVCRGSLYEALKAGEIESFKVGKKIVIPTAPLRRKLGL